MKCLECGAECGRIDNEHLLDCSGYTLHEYAIRHRLPLDLLLHPDQINLSDSPAAYPPGPPRRTEAARATLEGLRWAGLVSADDVFIEIQGEVRRLDLLLWVQQQLAEYGFRFRQDYEYSNDTHRVVAHNRLRTAAGNVHPGRRWASPEPPPAFLDCLAVFVAHRAEWHGGYLFMSFPLARHAGEVRHVLRREHGIECENLETAGDEAGALLRTCLPADGESLLALLEQRLRKMPGVWERFRDATPQATVSKELVFDAAHFITDHPAKCSNMHGGRYRLHVEIRDRIDPVTGCVVDYGYLKRVVNCRVIERFDHHHLNYAATELAWRSSTEMLCVYIWEQLIDYLPGLIGLRLYETPQSWCDYRGPTLAAFKKEGSAKVLHAFEQPFDPTWRRSCLVEAPALRAAGSHDFS